MIERSRCQRRLLAGFLLTLATSAAMAASAAAAPAARPRAAALATITLHGQGLEARKGGLGVRVSALNDDVLRIRVARDGRWDEDASWVVAADARQRYIHVQTFATPREAGFCTAHLQVRIERRSLRLTIEDRVGQLLSADVTDPQVIVSGSGFALRKQLGQSEHIFGLGDKPGPLDRRGQAFTNWNTDAYRFQEATDPLYKSVPFFLSVGAPGGSYGIFLDNTWRSWFDFGKRDPAVLEFGAAGGPIDYYVIYGPTPRQVAERYTDLTGKAPLAPLWALGFQQSRYSYMSATEVRSVASRLRAELIPADVIWLDIDYQDRNRPFTTNPSSFPDLRSLAADLRAEGLRLVAITDAHIAAAPGEGYRPYDSGVAGDHFVKRPDGSVYSGEVWPGAALFPDFTRRVTREWWGSLYLDLVAAGVAGFWNDMNEPSVFRTPTKTMPLETVHRIEEPDFATRSATHAEIHNVYGMENSRATYDGLRRLAPDERAFVMTRASFAGGQRYAVTWTGDNSSTWNHLKLAVPMLLNLGLSGFAYSGADVGGFVGAPSPELLTRWIEMSAFMPIFRDHSDKGSVAKEPWTHGPAQTAVRRHYIEERYRMLPYIYALADENARSGAPLMRPVFYEFPDALLSVCDQSTTFMLGDRLLIAPPPNLESPAAYDICLPVGRWYDYWSGREVIAPLRAGTAAAGAPAEQLLQATPALEVLPVFVRAGAIVPRQPLVQSTAEIPRGPLTLDVYSGDDCRGTVYQDDGHSMAFRRRGYLRQIVRCTPTAEGLAVDFEPRDGDYRPWWQTIEIVVHGWQGEAHARLDGVPLATQADAAAQTLRLTLADQPQAARLTLRR